MTIAVDWAKTSNSSGPLLIAYAINTKIACAGPFIDRVNP